MIHINEQRIVHCEKPVVGRYVAVYVNESQWVTLSICELEVYGTTISSEYSIHRGGVADDTEANSNLVVPFKPVNICMT